MERTASPIVNAFLAYQYEVLGVRALMAEPDVTEICINRPGELHVERAGGWQRLAVPELTYERAFQFCTTVVNEANTGQHITSAEPMASLTFPTGERAQFVIPPACEAQRVSITIRLPSRHARSLAEYRDEGCFDAIDDALHASIGVDRELARLRAQRHYVDFFRLAVRARKNIVVSGATGSGKTTFMKSLIAHIPSGERLVTIEDARELFLSQPNVVHLLYAKGGQSTARVTARRCMEACLRMRPDRIILAELRGDEAFHFIRSCASGHPGSITSCHAGSPAQTWDQLTLMVKASPAGAGLDYATIQRLLRATIDMVVHLRSRNGRREVSGIECSPPLPAAASTQAQQGAGVIERNAIGDHASACRWPDAAADARVMVASDATPRAAPVINTGMRGGPC